MTKIIAIANQKGGVGKTTTTANLGIGLAAMGHRVLLVDCDPQGSLTISLGFTNPDVLNPTLFNHLQLLIEDTPDPSPRDGILRHHESVDLMPANISLASIEIPLMMAINRENVLGTYLATIACDYDYVLIDCMPSLGLLTINCLTAADSVLIPVQAQYLPARGLEQLLYTIARVRRQLNRKLKVCGIAITMVTTNTNLAKDSAQSIRNSYSTNLKIFQSVIPTSTKVAESALAGMSIYAHDPNGKAAAAYRALTQEVSDNG